MIQPESLKGSCALPPENEPVLVGAGLRWHCSSNKISMVLEDYCELMQKLQAAEPDDGCLLSGAIESCISYSGADLQHGDGELVKKVVTLGDF